MWRWVRLLWWLVFLKAWPFFRPDETDLFDSARPPWGFQVWRIGADAFAASSFGFEMGSAKFRRLRWLYLCEGSFLRPLICASECLLWVSCRAIMVIWVVRTFFRNGRYVYSCTPLLISSASVSPYYFAFIGPSLGNVPLVMFAIFLEISDLFHSIFLLSFCIVKL